MLKFTDTSFGIVVLILSVLNSPQVSRSAHARFRVMCADWPLQRRVRRYVTVSGRRCREVSS